MRFAPTEEHTEFADAVRSLLADTCTPADVAASWGGEVGSHTGLGSGDGRVRPAWDALVEMGVLGLLVPEQHGGLQMDFDALAPIVEECGRVALPDPVGDTAGVVAPLLATVAGQGGAVSGPAAEWLSRIASGATVVSGFGAAPLVPAGTTADAFVLFTDDTLVLVEPDDIESRPEDSVDGSRGLVRVEPVSGAGLELASGDVAAAMRAVSFDRAATLDAAMLLGLCSAMLDMTVEYVSERRQFGVPVGSFQAVKHHLADAGSAIVFARPLVAQAAHLLSGGHSALSGGSATVGEAAVAVSMAKSRASRAAQLVSETALQCHGAIGYTVEADLQLFMKRSWALARSHGDEAMHRARVRRHLLGL